MIHWGEERRDKDPAFFCRLAMAEADKPVWLVCDARRPTDMDFFTTHFTTITVSNLWIIVVPVNREVSFCLGEGVCE